MELLNFHFFLAVTNNMRGTDSFFEELDEPDEEDSQKLRDIKGIVFDDVGGGRVAVEIANALTLDDVMELDIDSVVWSNSVEF